MTSTSGPGSFDSLDSKLDTLVERVSHHAAAPFVSHTSVAWRGGIDGHAASADGAHSDRLTRKLHAELSYWIADAGSPGSDKRRDFDDRWTFYQRQRLGELAWTLRLENAAALAEWTRGRAIVEIGGGPFPGVSMLHAKRAIALDPLADAYVTAGLVPDRARRVVYVAAPAERLPLPQRSADVVICENCLDHVEDPAQAMTEIARLLIPGGLLWLLVDLMEFRDQLHPNPMNHQRLADLLRNAGLEVLYQATWDGASHHEAKQQCRLLAWKPEGARPAVRSEPGRIADSSAIGDL